MKKSSKKKFHRLFFVVAGILCLLIPLSLFLISRTHTFKADVKHVAVEHMDIAYYTRGEGEPLLLIGGFGMTMSDWDPQLLGKLSKNHMLIILDYPATGLSKGEAFPQNEQALAKTMVGVLDQLHIQKTSIVGWSLGSFVGQMIAAQYPNRVEKLVLVSTAPGGKEMIGASEEVSRTIEASLGGTWEATYVPYLFPEDSAKDAYLNRRRIALEKGESPRTPQVPMQTLLELERMFADEEQETLRHNLLKDITSPTLILAGEQDVLLPVENDKKVAKQIPQATLITIPDAGHGVLFQEVKTVTEALEKFLKP